jgi:mannose-1-phosphate guanylyltransferase/MurNAc alpha-1-phosphate uridylyltransferase
MEPVAAPAHRISGTDLVGVALAAGAGTRLAPLSGLLPKALCPVGNRALVDLALDRLEQVTPNMAVNAHHFADEVLRHIDQEWAGAVTVSTESGEALGTAGALARLRPWIDGRGVIVVNADSWSPTSLAPLVDGWDGHSIRVMVNGDGGFGPQARIVASTLPWSVTKDLVEQPTGLYEVVWRDAFARAELEVVPHNGPFVDCGTPLDYLEANLAAAAIYGSAIVGPGVVIEDGVDISGSVIGAGSRINGDVVSSVVWPNQSVARGERLIRSIRAGTSVTVGPL